VFPIVGGRKVENLQKNIEALEITLSKEQIEFLENVLPFDVRFPNWLIVRVFFPSLLYLFWGEHMLICGMVGQGNGTKDHTIMAASAPLAIWPKAEPIKPSKQMLTPLVGIANLLPGLCAFPSNFKTSSLCIYSHPPVHQPAQN